MDRSVWYPLAGTVARLAAGAALLACLLLPSAAQAAFPGANGKIVFTSTRNDPNPTGCNQSCNWEIYTMNADGTNQTRLTTETAMERDPTWSPDGKKIAFSSNRDGDYEIYTMNADGSGVLQLTDNTEPAPDIAPRWSPDGTRIGFFREWSSLLIVSATGGPETYIESGDETFKFAWSPDAQQVAYGYYDTNLFKANADGTGVTPLISSLSGGPGGGSRRFWAPDWSSNGRDIVFMADTDYAQSVAALFVVGPNGYDVATYVPNSDHMVGRAIPEWSPDGTRFAFSSDGGDIDGPVELMVLNPDGSGPGVITAGDPAESGDPHWSPDGSRLVYSRQIRSTYPNATSGLHTINPDGTGDAVLTSGAWQDGSADWQPLRALDPYPRPGGASPLVVYFVPAYEQCTSPNTQHVAPLAEGSCTPPVQSSDLLTTSRVGRGKGFVRLDTVVGNPGTSADEADVRIQSEISDVTNASDQSDYAGNVILRLRSRVTDRAGGGFGGLSVTSQDFRFDVPISCTPSAPAPNGSDCSVSTTADSLWPGFIKEGKRMVMSTWEISVLDAGADGDIGGPPDCPRFCGTGDEQRFLEQGTFTP